MACRPFPVSTAMVPKARAGRTLKAPVLVPPALFSMDHTLCVRIGWMVNTALEVLRFTQGMDVDFITEQSAWQSLADRVEAPLPQRWIYGAAAEDLGRRVDRIVVSDKGHPIAIAQLVSRKIAGLDLYLATRGPLFLEPDMPLAQSRDVLHKMKRAFPRLALKVMTPEAQMRKLALSSAPTICDLDLTQNLDDLRAGLHGKWRNGLRRAERAKFKVAELSGAPVVLMPLLKAEKDRQSHGTYRALPPEFTLAIQKVAPRAIRLFSAKDAHMLFLRHGNSATYQIAHTGEEGRAVNAHSLMLWHAIKKLKSEGVTRLDLGTIDAEKASSLARFKLRTGAQPRALGTAQLM